MAYDKVVDSSVLDAGLKQVADAIREKGGTSDNLDFPTGMAAAVSAIQTGGGGGGGELPEQRLYCTLTADMTWTAIIEANPITPRYAKSAIVLRAVGDNAASQGSTTYRFLIIWVDMTQGNNLDKGVSIWYSYTNQLVSPNSMRIVDSMSSVTGSYITITNDTITSINRTNHYVAAANSIYLQEIPFDIANCRLDLTELGVS